VRKRSSGGRRTRFQITIPAIGIASAIHDPRINATPTDCAIPPTTIGLRTTR